MTAQPGVAVHVPPGSSDTRGGPVSGGQSPSASEREMLSGGVWGTVDRLREFQPHWRVRECGRWVAWGLNDVHVRLGDSGWSFGHLHRCGSPWSCPACAHQISMQRGAEVAHAVEWWRAQDDTGQADVVLLTLTVRHHEGDDLRALRRGLSSAWRAMQQARVWRELRAACGISHQVRCQEVTWGDNGWHPHLHVLLFCRRPGIPREYFVRDAQTDVCQGSLVKLWRSHVIRELGSRCLPNKKHALDIERCDDETYITRMGLEVGSPAAKHAKDGHMTAMQLASVVASSSGPEREKYGALWREYATAMHGAHQLHWSHGLQEELGVAESDGTIVSRPEHPERHVLATIPGETWREMARSMGLAPIAALGKSNHGLPESVQLSALLAFFAEREKRRCRWIVHDGKLCLRWCTT